MTRPPIPENPQPLEQVTIEQPSDRAAGAAVIGVVLTFILLAALGVFHG